MSNTKICPACQRELPLLAVRCKYCGFKQPLDREGGTGPRKQATRPMSAVPRSITSGTPKTTANPASPTEAKNTKRKQTVMGFGASGSKSEPIRPRTTMAPPPRPRGSHAPSIKKAPQPLKKPSATPQPAYDASASLGQGEQSTSQWIPELTEFEDDSQVVLLESDTSQTVELDLDSSTTEVSLADVSLITAVEDDSPEDTRLTPVFSRVRETFDIAVQWLKIAFYDVLAKYKALSAQQKKRLAMGVGGGLLLCIVGAVVLAIVGASPNDAEEEDRRASANDTLSDSAAPSEEARRDPAKKQVSGAASPRKAASIPDRSHMDLNRPCKPLSQYGSFGWKSKLKSAIAELGGDSVCDMMGQSVNAISDAFGVDANRVGNYDGLSDGQSLYVIPEKAVAGQHMEFLFYQNALFRISFVYGVVSESTFQLDIFEELWEVDAKSYTLPTQHIMALDDGEIRLEWITERNGDANRRLVFSDLKVSTELAKKLDALYKAKQLVAKGDEWMASRMYASAVDTYQDALAADSLYTAAWLGRGWAQVHVEDFAGARAAALGALKVTENNHSVANAHKLLSVVELFDGHPDTALRQLEQAAAAMPDNEDYLSAVSELKDGKYSTERVALTAARMSCLSKLKATPAGILARGNFADTESFFSALANAKLDISFDKYRKEYVSRECR